MDETQQIGTVKILDPYCVVNEKKMPEWVVPQVPKVWSIEKKTAVCSTINVPKAYVSMQMHTDKSTNEEQIAVSPVQSSRRNENKGQRCDKRPVH